MSLSNELISVLGMDANSNEVAAVVQKYALNDAYDDPPFRKYLGSSEKGVDLLFDNGRLLDIQIFVQKSFSHSAFVDDLPFGIRSNMNDKEIHELILEPGVRDSIGSRFTVLFGAAKLTVGYDKNQVVSYLSIRAI